MKIVLILFFFLVILKRIGDVLDWYNNKTMGNTNSNLLIPEFFVEVIQYILELYMVYQFNQIAKAFIKEFKISSHNCKLRVVTILLVLGISKWPAWKFYMMFMKVSHNNLDEEC